MNDRAPDICGDTTSVSPDAVFGRGVRIRSREVVIGPHCTFGDGVDIVCPDGVTFGACTYVGPGTRIRCWRFTAGAYLYLEEAVEIGRGGAEQSSDAVVQFGIACFCGTRTVINPAAPVKVGDETGIGAEVGIWTHGAWGPVDLGFPTVRAPVRIGSQVWLAGRSQVLPGVTIGDGAVIGMLSLVNRDIAPRVVAAGVPARKLRGLTPLSPDSFATWLAGLVAEYRARLDWLGRRAEVEPEGPQVRLADECGDVVFDCQTRRIVGVPPDGLSDLGEDLRDFLRRRAGIRFLTGNPFRSLTHQEWTKWR